MKKILVMVLAADINGYDKLIQAIRDTWGGQSNNENFKVVYYYGKRQNHPPPPLGGVLREGDTFICDCEECKETISLYF